MMMVDPFVLGCAVVAVVLTGLGKGGFVGIGTLSTPLLALALGPVAAAAVLLPILIVQDAVSVWSFRRHWDRTVLVVMMPAMSAGVALGYLYAAVVPERAVMAMLGAIAVVFGLWQLVRNRRVGIVAPVGGVAGSAAAGVLCGIGSGFCSQIAHAGAPPFQIWVMPRQLPRDVLVGTTAIAFAWMNWIKVPAYIALGQFTRANLILSATLVPLALGSTLAGVWIVRRIEPARFYVAIYVLMVLLGLKLLADGLV